VVVRFLRFDIGKREQEAAAGRRLGLTTLWGRKG